jgi:spermidine synthase
MQFSHDTRASRTPPDAPTPGPPEMPRRQCLALIAGAPLSWPLTARAVERLLLERRSPFATVFVYEDERGLRTLRFEPGGAPQSVVRPGDPDHLALAYIQALPVVFAYVPKAQRALLVGLGGGSLPSLLVHRLPALQLDVVELDPVVVEVARSHFGLPEASGLRVHVGDGRAFIERADARWDLVVLDAYDARGVPLRLATVEFLRSVRRVLAPGGVACANVWAGSANPLYDPMLAAWREVFQEVWVLEIPRSWNRIVIGLPGGPSPDRAEILRRSEAVAGRLALRTDLVQVVRQGLRPAGADGAGARPLRDTGRERSPG